MGEDHGPRVTRKDHNSISQEESSAPDSLEGTMTPDSFDRIILWEGDTQNDGQAHGKAYFP